MKPLEPPDSHHLKAAQGWLELGDHQSALEEGDHQSALEELELINPLMRAHPDVLSVRCGIYGAAKKWDVVVTVATALIKTAPKNLSGWIQRSYALHELK